MIYLIRVRAYSDWSADYAVAAGSEIEAKSIAFKCAKREFSCSFADDMFDATSSFDVTLTVLSDNVSLRLYPSELSNGD